MQRRIRSSIAWVAASALIAATQSACLSYSTSGPPVGPPVSPGSLGTAPPAVRVLYGSGAEELREDFERELARSGAFVVVGDDATGVDATLTLTRAWTATSQEKMFLLSAFTFFLLPFPAAKETIHVEARIEAPPAAPHVVSVEGPTIQFWSGILLAPLSFFHASPSKLLRGMSGDLARAVQQGYADYHTAAWQSVRTSADPGDYGSFLTAFPTSEHAAEVSQSLETALWKNVQDRGAADDYLRYLENFPAGRHAAEAIARGSDVLWRELSTTPGTERIETFLRVFPEDVRASQATALLEARLWRLATDPGRSESRYVDYYDRFPNGTHRDDCEDVLAWAEAERKATPASVEAYLSARPDGEYTEAARRALETLRSGDAGASSAIKAQVRESLVSGITALDTREPAVYTGTMTANAGGMRMFLEYEATYFGSTFVRCEILQGAVTYRGITYGPGQDGEWYPQFTRLFAD